MTEYIPHILVVDDDNKIRILLTRYLTENGFFVSVAKNADQARDFMKEFNFDLLIIDIMMPGESGLSLTSSIRWISPVPIIFLSAMGELDDKINGLEKGADDYLVKPFEPRELIIRIKRIIQRSYGNQKSKKVINLGRVKFDNSTNTLSNGDSVIKMTNSEIKLFKHLVNNIGVCIPRDSLADVCEINERSVDVQIIRIRNKIEETPKKPVYLQTIRGQGYILYEG